MAEVLEFEVISSPCKIGRRNIVEGVYFKEGQLFVVVPPGTKPEIVLERFRPAIDQWVQKWNRQEKRTAKLLKIINKLGYLPVEREIKPFVQYIQERMEVYEKELGVTIRKVTIRRMNTRWGSCNSLGNISIRKEAKSLPPRILDYLLYHEASHRLHPNHGPDFWATIAKRFPDYKELRALLKNWDGIVKKIADIPTKE